MFERYTEKARRVIFFARYQASQFGSSAIEAEFLLLGLLHEDPYTVIRWLDPAKNWQEEFRKEVEKRFSRSSMVATSVDLPLSHEVKRVLASAAEEVERLNHQWLGTEHLLLGLLRERQANASKILRDFGIDENTVREALFKEGEKSSHASRGGGHSLAVRAFQATLVIEGRTDPIQLSWPARLPLIGEFLTLNLTDKSGSYLVTKVEWKGSAEKHIPLLLSGIVIHAREAPAN
jgi:ATP-dependent Clp protease ATP-binding subunit ClpC